MLLIASQPTGIGSRLLSAWVTHSGAKIERTTVTEKALCSTEACRCWVSGAGSSATTWTWTSQLASAFSERLDERGERTAGRRENELNSATAPIAWSRALFAWSQESDKQAEERAGQRKNSHHLEQKESRDKQKKTQSSVHLKQTSPRTS